MRAVSRLFHRRLPPISVSEDLQKQQYRVNRIRGMQSQVPMTRTVQTACQQNTVRSAPSGSRYQYRKEMKDMRLRQGRAGGTWRHAREVLQSKGENLLFIDGSACLEDRIDDMTAPFKWQNTANQLQNHTKEKLATEDYRATEGANWRLVR